LKQLKTLPHFSYISFFFLNIFHRKREITYLAPVTGSASFPLIIKRGKRIENRHPLQTKRRKKVSLKTEKFGSGKIKLF